MVTSPYSNRPDFGPHNDYLGELSKFNVGDKVTIQVCGNQAPVWGKTPPGVTQAVNRTLLNAGTAASEALYQVGQAFSEGVSSATARLSSYFYAPELKEASEEAESLSNLPQETAIENKRPSLLADATSTAEQIKQGAQDVISAAEEYVMLFNGLDVEDPEQLEGFLNKLGLFYTNIDHGKAGLCNLYKTYQVAQASYKALVFGAEKYTKALADLEEAGHMICKAQYAVLCLAMQTWGKLQEVKQGSSLSDHDLALSIRSGLLQQAALATLWPTLNVDLPNARQNVKGTSLPKDFPKNLLSPEGCGNVLVALGRYLSDFTLLNQPDDRQLSCNAITAQLTLYKEEGSGDSSKSEVSHFMDHIRTTYGIKIKDKLENNLVDRDNLPISAWSSLTWGRVKVVMAALPNYMTLRECTTMNGQEKCLSLLSPHEREAVMNALNHPYVSPAQDVLMRVQTTSRFVSDGMGNMVDIQVMFPVEYAHAAQWVAKNTKVQANELPSLADLLETANQALHKELGQQAPLLIQGGSPSGLRMSQLIGMPQQLAIEA